ncbi:MAG: hypothetical protein GQ527_03470 [Bacteroidales bacterium]|nr:hypothetical protein [Bacteroidales bacterium]
MIKKIIYILILTSFFGCAMNYTSTSFYVKNNSDKTVNFKASIVKYSSMGPRIMTLPFTVLPHDSVLARIVGIRDDGSATDWFTDFTVFPTDGVEMNNPNDSINWIKSYDQKGKPQYIFNMTK